GKRAGGRGKGGERGGGGGGDEGGPIGLWIGKRPEDDRVENAEDGGGAGDADGEREDGDRRVRRLLPERAQSGSEIRHRAPPFQRLDGVVGRGVGPQQA